MRGKKLLAAFLLGVSLCFVPAFGYGFVRYRGEILKVSYIDFQLLDARINYMMRNPTNFLDVRFHYDPYGVYRQTVPAGIDTKGKIYVIIRDSRDVFIDELTVALLELFKLELETSYTYIRFVATDMNTDVVAKFYSRKGIPLGYFYQGEYHLWGE